MVGILLQEDIQPVGIHLEEGSQMVGIHLEVDSQMGDTPEEDMVEGDMLHKEGDGARQHIRQHIQQYLKTALYLACHYLPFFLQVNATKFINNGSSESQATKPKNLFNIHCHKNISNAKL